MSDISQVLPDINLRFHIDNPNVEECYAHGYESARDELSDEHNPHKIGTSAHEHWMDGWWDGFYGEQPLFAIAPATLDALDEEEPANAQVYQESMDKWLIKLLEISGVIAFSALVGYQLIDLVA